jgi:hypothetical protein
LVRVYCLLLALVPFVFGARWAHEEGHLVLTYALGLGGGITWAAAAALLVRERYPWLADACIRVIHQCARNIRR